MEDFDYEGYAVRYWVEQPDGRTILKDAFKKCDGRMVPLACFTEATIYDFYRNDNAYAPYTSVDNVLGMACLENREEGVYARCKLYDTPLCLELKKIGLDKYIKELTVFAHIFCELPNREVINGVITVVLMKCKNVK